ncbi:hypothetical protein J3E69DRAFT_159434 [Trichoderma sp. SZMC 28015]
MRKIRLNFFYIWPHTHIACSHLKIVLAILYTINSSGCYFPLFTLSFVKLGLAVCIYISIGLYCMGSGILDSKFELWKQFYGGRLVFSFVMTPVLLDPE